MALLEVKHSPSAGPPGGWRSMMSVSRCSEGEILGLFGHNGAGKSTIMGITLGMVRPDRARCASEVAACRKTVAALQQIGAIYEAASLL
jgi:ABC-2 type transport system ATP-binding protein